MAIRTPDVNNNILTLSGGNQQKALFARALASDAAIILMDDPMRGVDIGTKQEVYAHDPRGGRRRAAPSSGTRPRSRSSRIATAPMCSATAPSWRASPPTN